MKWVLIFASFIAMIGTAAANTYEYTARTEKPVKKTGTVTASGLAWQCLRMECRISGPWPKPGVGACAALAKEVGRIIEYGHPGAKLNKEQRATCNKSVSATVQKKPGTVAIPEIAKRLKKPKVPIPMNPRLEFKAPLPVTPFSTSPPELAIEEGSFEDYTLYVRTRTSIEFHGVYEGAYPTLTPGTPRISWAGNRLRLPGLRHTGTDDLGEQHPPFGSVPSDSVVETAPSGRFIEIPLSFAEIPHRVTTIEINCGVSIIPSGTGVYVAGEFSEQNTIGFAEGIFWRRPLADGDWQLNTTARLPINLRPFMDPSDIKSVVCDTQAKVMRLTRPGVDHVSFQRASDPSSTQFLPGLSTASGTTSVHRVIINVED